MCEWTLFRGRECLAHHGASDRRAGYQGQRRGRRGPDQDHRGPEHRVPGGGRQTPAPSPGRTPIHYRPHGSRPLPSLLRSGKATLSHDNRSISSPPLVPASTVAGLLRRMEEGQGGPKTFQSLYMIHDTKGDSVCLERRFPNRMKPAETV